MRIVRSTIAATDILDRIGDDYGDLLQNATCMFEYRGINDIYRCSAGDRSFFFKLYARKDIDSAAIEAEVEVVNHLKRSGLSVATPIPRANARYLLPINMPEGYRFGVLFTEAGGIPCDNDRLDDQEVRQIGHLVSEMHTCLDAMPAPPGRWHLDEQLFLDRSMRILENYGKSNPHIELPFLRQVVKELKEELQAKGGSWNLGLCHGDIFTGNIHRGPEGDLTIYDFDFCGYGWRAYDVSPFLGNFSTGVGEDAVANRQRRLEAFLRGYQHAGGFSDAEVEAIYRVFVPFRRLFNMGYLYHALTYVWGNRLRRELIARETGLLHEWMDYYW